MKSLPSIWRYVVNVKSTVKILSIFVAFLENINFTKGMKFHAVVVHISLGFYNFIAICYQHTVRCHNRK